MHLLTTPDTQTKADTKPYKNIHNISFISSLNLTSYKNPTHKIFSLTSGSTTDLSPMLNLYDKIKSTNFKETKSSEENLVEALASLEKLIDDRCGDGSSVHTMETTPHPPTMTMTTTVNKHKSSCVLSQNVQRLVSHSQSSLSLCTTTKQSTAQKEKHINLIQGSHPQKIFHIPLSRNISKLTQSCDDLVETLDVQKKTMDEGIDDTSNNNSPSQSRKSSTSSGNSDTPTLVPSTPPSASALVSSSTSSSSSPRTSASTTATRPVSVCSTSSSSSSGSDNLHEKHVHGVSYLASVESLAEHSEGEHETGIRLTVFERACLEIVDSERNYVNDLGQIINGWVRFIVISHLLFWISLFYVQLRWETV